MVKSSEPRAAFIWMFEFAPIDSVRIPSAVALALWFHDAIYNPQIMSLKVLSYLNNWWLKIRYSSENKALDSCDSKACVETDLQFLLDIDLAILAAHVSCNMNSKFSRSMRGLNIFNQKKRNSSAFLSVRPTTNYFQQNFELRAKQNLMHI